MAGPLAGLTILELAGMGPGPYCAMMMADMGANVIRVLRPTTGAQKDGLNPVVGRGMRSIVMDLKSEGGRHAVLRLAEKSDALIEGFRPGVMERLGLGPDVCLSRNKRLVYGRMTGWGQYGTLSDLAGHDINYIALTGALAAIGTSDSGPVVPLNLLGDFGGGGMMLAFGIACALLEAAKSGEGQVVDAAMSDGAAMLMATTYGYYAAGRWQVERGSNLLDGAAHFYTTYRCADDKWIAVGAIEPQFYSNLLMRMGLDPARFQPQHDQRRWSEWKSCLAQIFATRSRDEWCAVMDGVDACFSPVLDLREAPLHPHNLARSTFFDYEGTLQPAPAPRFSRTSPEVVPRRAESTQEILSEFGLSNAEIADLCLATS